MDEEEEEEKDDDDLNNDIIQENGVLQKRNQHFNSIHQS